MTNLKVKFALTTLLFTLTLILVSTVNGHAETEGLELKKMTSIAWDGGDEH